MPDSGSFEERIAQNASTLRAWLTVVTVGLFLLCALGVFAILKAQIANDNVAAQAHHAVTSAQLARVQADQAKALAVAVTRARRDTLHRFCEKQNLEHRQTIRTLDERLRVYAQHIHDPAHLKQLRASKSFTTVLIDKIVPLEHCH